MATSASTVTVHLGSEISDPGEVAFLARLRRDLGCRGVTASVVANFHTTGRSQRQIDFLVLTPVRLTHVELKTLSQAAPLSGSINGRWRQHLRDGRTRELDTNPYVQAKDGTYALSDLLKSVVRRRGVPSLGPAPYKHIDTVVCVDPGIPPGSRLARADHVVAIGYDELLDRLVHPGPRPSWDQAHWEQFLLDLEVSLEDPASPAEQVRRAAGEVIADYCAEFAARRRDGLHEFMPVQGADEPGAGLLDLISHVADGGSLTLLGPSGHGKSHAAQHIAARLTERGAVVLWLRAGEYRAGRFAELVARASAPFSALSWQEVLHAAELTGTPLIAVLDGLNECPDTLRDELLEQLNSFQLRHPSWAVITSIVAPITPLAAGRTLTLGPPTDAQRGDLLRSYGTADPDRVSDAFQTPYELSIAAQCEADLPVTATQADLFDRYIVRLGPAETTRAGLRAVAWAMDDQLRASIRRLDTVAVLAARTGPGLRPAAIDQVLTCPLLDVGQGSVSFRHELIGRFLVAEELVLRAASGEGLAAALEAPGHADLAHFALSIEHDSGRRAEALDVLASTGLFHAAATGVFGPAAAEHTRGAIRGALADGAFVASNSKLHVIRNREQWPDGEWAGGNPLSRREQALLGTAGHVLADGLFVEEVCELLDRTDALVASEVERFRRAGSPDPISPLLALTYAFGGQSGQVLACSNVVKVYRDGDAHWTKRPSAGHVVGSLIERARGTSWGRLYLALLLLHPDDPSHQQLFPDLLARAWAAGGYHLRLEALHAAQRFASMPDPHIRAAIGDFLEDLDPPHNLGLSTTLVEALAGYHRLECGRSVEDIVAELSEILARPDDPTHQKLAAGAYQMQFENETAVGPYCQAIQSLPHRDRIRLLVMATGGPEGIVNLSWVLEELAELAPTGDLDLDADLQQVFRQAASTVRETSPMVQEGVSMHVAGLRGWAAYAAEPPSTPGPSHGLARAWRAVDRLILGLLRGAGGPYDAVWDEILGGCAADAVDVFHQLRFGASMSTTESIHDQLVQTFPNQSRQLLEWGLQHRSSLTSHLRCLSTADLEHYVINTLGVVGNEMTAVALSAYLSEPDLAGVAVAAIRQIRGA